MNNQERTKEELIKELQELREAHNALKVSAEADSITQKQTMEALKASEERFQLLFNKAPLGYQSLDFDGNFIEVNQQWLDTLGYESEEVIGKWFGDFLTPVFKDGFRKRFPIFKELGKIHSEFEMIHKNGSVLFIAFDGRIGYDLKGKFKQTHCILQDITERKQAEIALLESEEKLSTTLQSIGDAVISTDNNGFVLSMNPVAETLCGWKLTNALGKPLTEVFRIINAETRQTVADPVEKVLENGQIVGLANHTVLISKDGAEYQISDSAAPIRNKEGAITGVVLVFSDITGSYIAQKQIKKSEERFNLAMKASNDGLFDWNLKTNEIYYSPAWKKMLGYEDDELPNDFSVWENTTDSGDVKKSWELQQKLINKEVDRFVLEFKMKHKDGHWVDILSRAEAIFNDSGKAVRIVGTHTDITERKRAEEKEKELLKRFELISFHLPGVIYQFRLRNDGSFHFPYASPGIFNIYGVLPKDVEHDASAAFKAIYPEDLEQVSASIYHSAETLTPWHDIYRVNQPSGKTIWVEGNSTPQKLDDGSIIWHGFIQDITERHHANQELIAAKVKAEESEEKYRLLHENAGIGIGYYKVDGTIISYNTIAARNMNGVPEDFKGKSIYDLFPGSVAEFYHERIKKAAVSEIPVTYEDEVNLPTGNNYFLSTYARIINTGGEIEGIQIMSHDITEQKELENAIIKAKEKTEESEERFNLAMKASNDGLFDWNLETNEIYYSPGWKKMLGYEDDELPNDFSVWENTTDPEHVRKSWELQQKLINKEVDRFVLEFKMKHKEGHWVDILSRAEAFFNDSGKAVRIVGTHTDISERKRAEELLQEKSEEIEVQNEELNQTNQELTAAKLRAEESEAFFKASMDNSHAGIIIAEYPTGKMKYANKAALLIRGKEYDEIVKDIDVDKYVSSWQIFHFDGTPFKNDETPLARAILFGETYSCEGIIRRDNNEDRYVWANAAPIYNAQGIQTSAIVVFLDITDRKQAEEKLHTLEQQSHAWLENSPTCTKIVDLDFNLQYMSSAGVKGLNIDDITPYYGKPYPFHFYPESFKTKMTGNMKRAKETGKIITQEAPVVDLNGNEVWFHSTIVPAKDDNGRIEYLIIVSMDTTERKLAEEKLRESEAIKNTMVSNISDVIVIIDQNEIIQYKSPNSKILFGWQPEELVGKSTWVNVHPDDLESGQKFIGSIATEPNATGTIEVRYKRKDGEFVWIEFSVINLLHDKDIQGLLGNYHDISERKQAEMQLRTAKEKAEESDRLKSAFLANMSHEIRTPLNSIIGFSELLNDPDYDAVQKETFAGSIITNGNNLLNIISDVMDISKIESGEITIRKSKVDVMQFLDEIRLMHIHKVEQKNLRLDLDFLKAESNSNVFADKERLLQIFNNLISNALKFTSEGHIKIGFRLTGDMVEFHVKDTGIGIPADYHQKIFDRFRQVEASYTRKYGGNGLGLAISKKLIELMGGKIWVESELGKGATFYFTLPQG